MRKNKLKEIFKSGKSAVNGWLQIPNSFTAELMANQNWDSLTLDMQHGVIDYPNAINMLQAISTTKNMKNCMECNYAIQAMKGVSFTHKYILSELMEAL